MDANACIQYIDRLVSACLSCEGDACTLEIPPPASDMDPESLSVARKMQHFFDLYKDSCRFTRDIANGRLDAEISRDNILAMPTKALQANLKHLTWQAKDYKLFPTANICKTLQADCTKRHGGFRCENQQKNGTSGCHHQPQCQCP